MNVDEHLDYIDKTTVEFHIAGGTAEFELCLEYVRFRPGAIFLNNLSS